MDSIRECSIEGCERPKLGRGLCRIHWNRWRQSVADPCIVDGCDRPERARKMCVLHLSRLYRHGSLELPPPKPKPSMEDRFWTKVNPTGFCWEWVGARDPNGYGVFNKGPKLDRSHRVAYELLIGAIPNGLFLDHLCRNTSCCNPDHLEPVTPGENARRGMAPTQIAARSNTCRRGHSLADAYIRPDTGGRQCRPCMDMRKKRRAIATKAAS